MSLEGGRVGVAAAPVFALDTALTTPFEFTVVKRSFPEFLESYLDLAQSEDAPLPPWVVFTQLPALQQKSEMQRAKHQTAEPDGAQPSVKRRPRVVFDDEAACAGGRAHSTATVAAASAEGNSAHRQAVMKKMKAVTDALHLQLAKDVCDAKTVRDYFAIKSLVEFLPSHSLISNPGQGLLTSSPFLAKAKEIVEHLAQVHTTQTASHSARFKRLALRRAGGAGGAEGAVIGHHYGARHAYQLFLRTLVEPADRDGAVKSGSGAGAAAATRRASMRSSHNATSAMATRAVQEALPPTSTTIARDDVLALVEQRSGLPHRRITTLHLQSRGFQRDSRYFGKIVPDNVSEANSAGLSATKRAMSVGQLSAASSQRDLRTSSNQSSGVYEEQTSDTRSTHSATTGGASSSTAGGHTGAAMQSTMASPGWLLKKHDFWIALKGIVFRIRTDLTVDDLPPVPQGRGLYYRLVLLPVFSGRDCTRAFAWAQLSCSPMDFLSVEDYVNTWRSKLLAASGAAPLNPVAPSLEQGFNEFKFASAPREWPVGLREHINRIFSTFLHDFEVLGELEDGREDLWF